MSHGLDKFGVLVFTYTCQSKGKIRVLLALLAFSIFIKPHSMSTQEAYECFSVVHLAHF